MKKGMPLVTVHNIIRAGDRDNLEFEIFLVTASLAPISPCRGFNRGLRGLHRTGRTKEERCSRNKGHPVSIL